MMRMRATTLGRGERDDTQTLQKESLFGVHHGTDKTV